MFCIKMEKRTSHDQECLLPSSEFVPIDQGGNGG